MCHLSEQMSELRTTTPNCVDGFIPFSKWDWLTSFATAKSVDKFVSLCERDMFDFAHNGKRKFLLF